MNTTNAEERVKRNRIMDKFCGSRKMEYEPVNTFDQVDAKLYMEGKNHLIGLAKIKSCPCNFGTNPSVPVDRQLLDFLFELAKLGGTKAVLIIKFRDKLKYTRLEEIDKLSTATVVRGKTESINKLIPINCFADL